MRGYEGTLALTWEWWLNARASLLIGPRPAGINFSSQRKYQHGWTRLDQCPDIEAALTELGKCWKEESCFLSPQHFLINLNGINMSVKVQRSWLQYSNYGTYDNDTAFHYTINRYLHTTCSPCHIALLNPQRWHSIGWVKMILLTCVPSRAGSPIEMHVLSSASGWSRQHVQANHPLHTVLWWSDNYIYWCNFYQTKQAVIMFNCIAALTSFWDKNG